MTEAQPFFVGVGWVGLVFGAVLVALPCVQLARGDQSLVSVRGLLVSGAGFLLFGAGFAFAHRGWGDAVLPGILLATAGHFLQRRAARAPSDS